MNRRARLTLISVCLVALLAGAFSAYYLKTEIERQFKFAFDRADLMKRLASDNVARSLERQSVLPSPEAQATDADLTDRLRTIMAVSRSLLEITVCDPGNKVLLSTDASRHVGDPFPGGLSGLQPARHRVAIDRQNPRAPRRRLAQVLTSSPKRSERADSGRSCTCTW